MFVSVQMREKKRNEAHLKAEIENIIYDPLQITE
jgi:hypothetical protein